MTRTRSRSREEEHKSTMSNLVKALNESLNDTRFRRLAGVLLLFIVTPYLIVAFSSYIFTWRSDMSIVKEQGLSLLFQSKEEVVNWLGRFGAVISHLFIYNWFGITSYFFVLIFFLTGFKLMFGISLLPVKRSLKHSFFFLVWLSITLGYIFKIISISEEARHLMGGAFGIRCDLWLQGLLGSIGTGFLLVFVFIVYLIVSFDVSFNWFNTKKNQPENIEDKFSIPVSTISAATGIELGVDSAPGIGGKEDSGKIFAENEKGDGDLELTIEKGAHEEIISSDEIKDRREFTEYDPTLDLSSYSLPSVDLLDDYGSNEIEIDKNELESHKDKIVETLANYNISIDKIKATVGPTVTLYEIVPAPGVRISKIKNLEDDIALSLSALGIRIIAPMPGKGTVGIEVPNNNPRIVSIKSILSSEKFINSEAELPIGLGRTIANEILIADLTKMPHLLMAGATGQGKSVGLNAILISLLYKKHPAQVKFVLIDPKIVELTLYKKLERHFLAKLPDAEDAIISDTKKVVHTLHSLCFEMEDRYKLLQDAGERELKRYNSKFINRKLNPQKGHRFLPYIVVIIDEFADLIMSAGKEIESPLTRLAQKSRAIGIHLVIATQRPSVNIITGTIKANFPVRIAFRVSSRIDSGTILDRAGAEQLVGKGDMLLSTGSDLIRLQCAFVDTPEVDKVMDYISTQQGYPEAFMLPEYLDESSTDKTETGDGERDAQFEEAARIVVQHQQGSASLLQRRLKIGYNRAGRIVDQLEAFGIVGPFDGSKARQVLIHDEYTLEQFLSKNNNSQEEKQL